MKKILFVTYGGGHVNIVIPIVREIEKHNNMDYQILALTTAIPYLENSGLKYKTLLDYLPILQNNKEIINIGNKLASEYHNSDAGFSIEQTSAYLGCSMYDLIKKLGEKKALEKFEIEGRKAFCPTSIIKQILKIEKPDIVVTTVPYRMEKAAVLEAKELGIKTVFIHDLHFVKQNYLYNIVDANFVMNEFVKDELIGYGVAESKIYVTGQPAFDYLLEPINKSKSEIYNEFELSPEKKTIVWIADNSKVLTKTYFDEISKVIERFKEFQFIIKMHPGEENVDIFKNICKKNKINTLLLHRCNNKVLIYIGDLFLVGLSTMGLEISRMNKNMICLDYDNLWKKRDGLLYKNSRYDYLGLGILVNKTDDLSKTILNVLDKSFESKNIINERQKFWYSKNKVAKNIIENLKSQLIKIARRDKK